MDGTIGIVTDIWLALGDYLDRDVEDLAQGAGLGMLCLNRARSPRSTYTLTKLDLPNHDKYEVLVSHSSIPGYVHQLLAVGCYLPPNYTARRAKEALEHIENVVLDLKRKYKDPFIIVGEILTNGP